MFSYIHIFAILFWVSMYSCGEKSFKAGGETKKPQQNNNALPQPLSNDQQPSFTFNIQEDSQYPVDILFLIDSSNSMDAYVDRVRMGLPGMISSFQQQNANYNYRLFVVTKKNIFGQFEGEKFRYIAQGIGSHNSLEVGQKLVDGIAGDESDQGLRDGAVKEFIVVTDDNSHINPEAFRQWSVQKANSTGPVHVNGIVRMGSHCSGSILTAFSDASPGTTYHMISTLPETRGVIQELCSPNWSQVFMGLQQQLLQRKRVPKTKFVLPQPVTNQNALLVRADGRPLAPGTEWIFNADKNEITITADISQNNTLEITSK